MMSNLGDKIKEIRISQGLSQEDLAKELGYTSRSTIAKIEKGVNEISFDKLQLLLKKYDLEMNELFDDFAYKTGGK
ncbi:MAG: helix-turn-helix domain-containing protein, partial [Gammaproteobacteria bacterium]|nr:helix-turn-helix domain-containing protein [Gammaproteobacteria bacterium]